MRVIHRVLVMLLVLAMVACTTPTVPLPTAVPPFGPGGQTATVPATPTGAQETATEPAEGATPGEAEVTGPSLASATPTPGQELALDGQITLVFDEDMDPASVEQALRVEPEIDVQLEWPDPRTLAIAPAEGEFAPDTEYVLVVNTSATSAQGEPLAEPVQWLVATTGVANVAQMVPEPDSTDVAVTSPLRLIFDRPIVPLVGIQEQSALPWPVTIEPATEGTGAWINTSIFEFTPAEGWLGGTTYTIATVERPGEPIVATITPSEWSFTTAVPRVLSVTPAQDELYAAPDTTVTLTFNQPMATDETAKRFTLRDAESNRAVEGAVTWEKESLVFAPAKPLARGQTYEVVLAQGSPAASGEMAIETTYTARFRVAPALALEGSQPRSGAKNVAYDELVQLSFSCPIDRDSLMATLKVEPKAEFYIWTDDLETTASVSMTLKPSTAYTLTIGKGLEDRYGATLGKDVKLTFTTAARRPSVWLNTPGDIGMYDAHAEPTIYVSTVNVASVTFELYNIGADGFVELTRHGGYLNWDEYQPNKKNLIREWTTTVDTALNEVGTIKAPLGKTKPLGEGYYVLRVSAPGVDTRQHHLLVVTPYNLVLKSNSNQALLWATDLQTGQPVKDLALALYGEDGKRIATATTDQDGLASAKLALKDPWSPVTVIGAEETAAVLRSWDSGISPWEFGVSVELYAQPLRIFTYSDRSIYRPGQTVYFKGYVRADDDGAYSLPETGMPVNLELFDSQGRVITQDKFALSETGSFDGAILLSEDASLGYYYGTFTIGEQYADLSFLVAEYRKPEFEGTLTLDKPSYVHGDVAKAQVSVNYFFGGSVSKSQVVWTAIKQPYTPTWEGLEDYTFGDESLTDYPTMAEYGGPFADGTGETDANGNYTFEVPVDLSTDRTSQHLVLYTTVIDANNQEVTLTGDAILHKADAYAGLRTDAYVGSAGDEMSVEIISVDAQGKILPKTKVQVSFLKHEWYSVKEETPEGEAYWTNKTRETEVDSVTVTTDAKGLAKASFTPEEGGAYRVRTTVYDAEENENHSSLYLWVSANEFVNWGQQNDNLLQLVADKHEYAVGDVARVLVPAPFDAPALALVTIERGGVLEHSLVEFDGVSQVLEVPITEDHVPNIYLSVTMVVGAADLKSPATFKVGYVELPVDISSRVLDLRLEPAQDTYAPREEAQYTITTLDAAGKPVSAEVSLQLVDLAVETLVGTEPRSIIDAFYRERGLGVSTAASLTVSVERTNLELAREGKGGGGGEGGAATREYFPDTAYWRATLVTDEDGQATISVLLPDNLTTWRMHAQAMSTDSLVGTATVDIVTKLDLMVRPSLPRFLVLADEPELTAVVHNNTAKDLDVDVSLMATQVEVDTPEQHITVPAGDKATVSWKAHVTGQADGGDMATFTVSASAGSLSDAVEIELPILRSISPEVVGTSGQVDDQVVEQVQVPLLADTDWGALVVLLEPSLAAGMTEGLRYLQTYPYDCVEQTVSRFYPNVVTYRALQELGIERPDLAEKLPQQVALGLQRLNETQNLDGGWGWWAGDSSNATLTAYVVTAMVTARDAGFAVEENALSRAISFLWARLDQEQVDSRADRDERAAVLYALALSGDGDLGRSVALFDERDGLSLYGKAYLTMTLALLEEHDSERLTTLSNELEQAAIWSGTQAHWEEAEASPWSMNTDTRTSAMVLRALVQLTPDSKTLPAAVCWLMTARSAARWETTQENVWAIVALTDYMVATGELEGEYDYAVALNGKTLEEGTVTPETIDQVMVQQVPIGKLQREDGNAIALTRSEGPGQLYYSAYLNYYLPVDRLMPLSRGIYVQRQYTYLDAAGKPAEGAVLNGLIEVKLTLIAPHDLYYLVIEDALPAGCEAIDPALATSRRVDESAGLAPVGEDYTEEPFWRQAWPTHTEYHDEKVSLFAAELIRGTYEYTYTMRCSAPGLYNVLPALAYEMYAPDVMGRSAGVQLEIAR